MEVKNLEDEMALTVRIRNGKLSLTGGAVAGGGEQLTQILTIRARDLNTAIQIAARTPHARAGAVEVRAVEKRGPSLSFPAEGPG